MYNAWQDVKWNKLFPDAKNLIWLVIFPTQRVNQNVEGDILFED